jgi:hypothetical protein
MWLGGGKISLGYSMLLVVSDVRQKEIHTAEPLVPEPNAFEVEMAIEVLKDTNHHQKLLRQMAEQFALRYINLLNRFGIRRNCLRTGRSRSLHPFTRREIKLIVVIRDVYHFCQLLTDFIQNPAVKVNSICRGNYWGLSLWISMQHINYRSTFCILLMFEKIWR